jgi:hypothetical protein
LQQFDVFLLVKRWQANGESKSAVAMAAAVEGEEGRRYIPSSGASMAVAPSFFVLIRWCSGRL